MQTSPKLRSGSQPHGLRPYESDHQKNGLSRRNQQLLDAAVGVRYYRPPLQKLFLALQKDEAHRQCAGWVNPPSVPSFQCSGNLCKQLLSPLCAGAFHWLKHLWILPRFHGCPKIKLRTVDHEVIRLMVLAVDNEMFV